MITDDQDQQILEILKDYVDKQGIEVFEIKILRRGTVHVIDVIADKKNGGITIDECAKINVYLRNTLEETDIFDDYVVQVSSPGLDRPLTEKRDFLRVIDKEIQVYLLEPHEGRVQYDGRLTEVKNSEIILNVKQNLVVIPLKKINKGIQVF